MIKNIGKHKHHPDCYAVKNVNQGTWDTVWGTTTFQVFANKYGRQTPKRKGNNILWNVSKCNCTFCKAELWVKADDYYKELPKQ